MWVSIRAMFEQMIYPNKGQRRPWTYLLGLAGELVAIGFMMLLPLIYTDQISNFGFGHLPMIAPPRGPEPKPLSEPTVRPAAMRVVRVFRQDGFFAPTKVPDHPVVINDLDTSVAAYVPVVAPDDGLRVIGGIGVGGGNHPVLPPPPPVRRPEPTAPAPVKVTAPLRVGGDVQAAMLMRKVVPVYPQIARQTRISGTVRLAALISRDGTIEHLQVLSGHPMLTNAAIEAVRQWVYRPTMLNGEAVEVQTVIDVNFTLAM